MPIRWNNPKTYAKYADYARFAKPDNARKLAKHMVPHVVRPAQIIWNKALGAIFALLALEFFYSAVKNKGNLPYLIAGVFLGSVMAFFAITSYLRVRRLSRL